MQHAYSNPYCPYSCHSPPMPYPLLPHRRPESAPPRSLYHAPLFTSSTGLHVVIAGYTQVTVLTIPVQYTAGRNNRKGGAVRSFLRATSKNPRTHKFVRRLRKRYSKVGIRKSLQSYRREQNTRGHAINPSIGHGDRFGPRDGKIHAEQSEKLPGTACSVERTA